MNSDSEDCLSFYSKIYRLFDKLTPLPVDCGQLCEGACCKGDSDTGMLLFPGEEAMFKNIDGFIIKDTDFFLSDGFCIKLLICTKDCDRKKRPLSCRIFPLFGVLDNNNMKIVVDPRAKGICPLAKVGFDEGFTTKFIIGVEKAFKMLLKNERCKEFIEVMKYELMLEDV